MITMKREQLKEIAEDTLKLIESGDYYSNYDCEDYRVDILYTPESINHEELTKHMSSNDTLIRVLNCSTMEAYTNNRAELEPKMIACLNFASNTQPGGGFLKGVNAQEECLTRSSNLYKYLLKFKKDFYEKNIEENKPFYSDNIIYNQNVTFFKDDEGNIVEPYIMDVITSPAVDFRKKEVNSNPSKAKQVMLNRIDNILATALHNDVNTLILGAWGCGVFKNDPKVIAECFAHFLIGEGKYAKAFEDIIFAIKSSEYNLKVFKEVFEKYGKINY